MNTSRMFAAAICAILAGSTGPVAALGQTAPAADRWITDNGGDWSPQSAETMVCPLPDAGRSASSCCPRWTVSAEFVTLERVGTFPSTLVSMVHIPPTLSTEVLNATDLHQGFAGGPRLGLIHHGDGDGDLEVSYFQIDGWDSYRSIGPTPNDWLVMTAPGGFVQTQDSPPRLNDQMMAWAYSSRLCNAELNVRWEPWRRVTVLAGFRWAQLREELQGILAPPGTDGAGTFWDTQTRNNLYGVQIGADGKLLERGRFSIDSVLKAGLFDNHVEETTTVRMARIQYGESASTDHAAFLGEIGLQCKYRLTQRLLLKAGYEAIWLEGVALAPGQISETYCHAPTSPILPQDGYVQAMGVNSSSGVYYHGATAGLEYSF
jgi:hypothetical protein